MSHEALSQPQFHEQLKLFMSPQEIIERAHKGDSSLPSYQGRLDTTPREEWEHPDSGYGQPLRDAKLAAVMTGHPDTPDEEYDEDFADFHEKPFDSTPPVSLYHLRRWAGDDEKLWLRNGHHRLAWAEHKGVPYMAVRYHEMPKR